MALSNPFPEGFRGIGPLGNELGAAPFSEISASQKFELVLSVAIGVMTVIAGIWFMINIFTAAIQWLSAGSDKQALQNAQKKLANSIAGLLVVVTSYGLILVIGNILGFSLILWPGNLIITSLHP